MRPEFDSYVADIHPQDPDDTSVARPWLGTLPAHDAELVAPRGAAEIARVAREALSDPDGYLRDAAVTFRAWQFRVESVNCPVFAWYGDGDDTYSVRNGEWYVDALGATLAVRRGGSHLGALLEQWPHLFGSLIAT
jgi:pimeloyl-ACP methyl ester carboxylesterase